MASTVSTNPFSMNDMQGLAVCGTPETAEGSPSSGQEATTGRRGNQPAYCAANIRHGPVPASHSSTSKFATSETPLSTLNGVYFREGDVSSEGRPTPPASAVGGNRATVPSDCLACVAWELEQLPRDGELVVNLVARLEQLKACNEEAGRSLISLVAERQEELTKAASVLGELRAALENLRRESAAVRVGLSRFRQQSLLPSLDITKQQRAKLLLQREMHQLLYVQRVEAILMAAENSCVNRQLPLQAALLMEGAALFLPPSGALPPSALEGLSQEIGRDTAVLAGTKKMQQMLESLKADLNAALQAAARSLPPPPCGCGWRLPEPVARCSSRGGVWMSRAFSSASPGPGEGTWPLYYSALAAFALLPPSCSVGSAISAAMTAAAAAATRQVLCAFVPADAAAFSEAEADGLEAQRACARILLCSESGDHSAAAAAAIAADAATALPSPKGLAASVDAADAAACFMTLLGVHYDFLMGASSLMRWHASEALRLLAQVKAERCSSHNRYSERPLAETGELGLLGGCHSGVASYGALVDRKEQLDTGGASPRSDIEFKGTYELAATATQRLRGLPSSLRMALFLLQVRKQFLCQRSSLWQHLQQQTAEVLEQLDLGIEGPTAVNDCLSLMHAVQVFVAIGESFVASEDTAAESQLAAEAAAAAATVAAADKTTTHDMGSQPFGEETDGDSAAAAAVAADAVAAAAAATAAGGNTESNMQGIPSNPAAGRLSQVLVVRVLAAIESLHETHIQQMLQHVRAETWQRLPILRRFPLVLLRTSSPVGALPVLPEGISPSTLAAETFGSVAQEGGANAVCGRCGEAVATYGAPNPFAHWQPGMPFVGPGPQAPPQKETADVELAAIEEELRAAEACGRRTDEPPVAVAASQAASRAFMQYWQLAVSAPEVAATAVRAMVRLMGFYVAAVAASVLPEETCSCLAAAPMQGSPYGEVNSRSKVTAIADAATLRCRLPHLHWLLSQTGRDLERLQKKLLRGSSTGTNEIGSGHSGVGARTQLPLLCELIRPMAKLASPGALWGLAERVAAVESARDLLEALAQQLHLQGLPQDFGGSGELRVGQEQQRQQLAGHGASRRLLCSLPREEQQQLWRLLAATRCGIVDLRALVYRLAAGSLCQSSAFTASFQQAATESGVNWSVAVAARDYDPVSAATRPRASDAIPRAYAAAVQQHRRQVADLFWKIRCAGSGSIPADVQLIIWRAVRSQTIADAIDVLSAVPLAADSVERCLNPGPLVAIAEALREIIAEAGLQYGKAAAASGTTSPEQGRSHPLKVVRSNATAADGATDRPHCNDSSGESPLDLDEADFDCFVDVCSRTAPEVMQWCQAQRDRTFGPQGDGKGRAPPLRVMSQMLQRLENQGLLQRGQTAEFENRQSLALMQLTQPPH